jgi:hypothetical protein
VTETTINDELPDMDLISTAAAALHRLLRLGIEPRYRELADHDLEKGLDGLPAEGRELVRELGCFYDNMGALVAHGIVDIELVAGYLGGSIVPVWEAMRPLVEAERAARTVHYDATRWQAYFENLYVLVKEQTPGNVRSRQKRWRLPQ